MSHENFDLAKAKDAFARHDETALIEMTSGANHFDLSAIWAGAMTAKWGPVGLHASRRGPDGRPSQETLDELPEVGRAMADGWEKVRVALSRIERLGL